MVHEELLPASILIAFNGEVKIGDAELCRRDGDKGKASKALQKLTMALMDKSKPTGGPIGLSYPQKWSSDAFDMFTMTASEDQVKKLLEHPFLNCRDQATLVWLIPFIMITASHVRE